MRSSEKRFRTINHNDEAKYESGKDSVMSKASSGKLKLKPSLPNFNSPVKLASNKINNLNDKNAKFSKLETLKFKMALQTKNLQTLTGHNDLMTNIYQDDRFGNGARGLKRESNR